MTSTGSMRDKVTVMRATLSDDGYTSAVETWAQHGGPIWAAKADLSDGERFRAGEVAAHITTRFVVRSSAFARGITPKDRLVCRGRHYDIFGIKDVGNDRAMIEITAAARID